LIEIEAKTMVLSEAVELEEKTGVHMSVIEKEDEK
jgi:hypothetical protein